MSFISDRYQLILGSISGTTFRKYRISGEMKTSRRQDKTASTIRGGRELSGKMADCICGPYDCVFCCLEVALFHFQPCNGRKFGLLSTNLENWLFFWTVTGTNLKKMHCKGVDFSFISLHCKGRISDH